MLLRNEPWPRQIAKIESILIKRMTCPHHTHKSESAHTAPGRARNSKAEDTFCFSSINQVFIKNKIKN
jgi:hypothetical protein